MKMCSVSLWLSKSSHHFMVHKRDSEHYQGLIPWEFTEWKYYIFLCGFQERTSEQEVDTKLLHSDHEEGNSYKLTSGL